MTVGLARSYVARTSEVRLEHIEQACAARTAAHPKPSEECPDPPEQLIVTPLLCREQVCEASIDVRLGNEFLFPTRHSVAQHRHDGDGGVRGGVYSLKRVDFNQDVFLHPRQFVLGATLEYIGVPDDLACYLIGRSSLGRTGLVIATATFVGPGFRGCVTLEITNIGEVPLPLVPGMRIAQLVVHQLDGRAKYEGRFSCATGPLPPDLFQDRESHVWRSFVAPPAPGLHDVIAEANQYEVDPVDYFRWVAVRLEELSGLAGPVDVSVAAYRQAIGSS